MKKDEYIFDQLHKMRISTDDVDISKKIKAYQLEKFINLVHYANKNSPFYKKLYTDFDIFAIRSEKDIENLPTISEEDIIKNGQDMLCFPANKIRRSIYTSGTIGRKQVFMSERDIENIVSYFTTGISRVCGNGGNVLILYPHHSYGSIGHLLGEACKKMQIPYILEWPIDILQNSTRNTNRTKYFTRLSEKIVNEDVATIIAPTNMIEGLAGEERNFPALKNLLLSSEYIANNLLSRLRHIFNAKNLKMYEHYASAESGYGIALSCGRNTNCYCVRDADIFLEEISNKVVITTLNRYAMPLIRYESGDRTENPTSLCPFDSPLSILGRIGNRGYKKGEWIY